MTKGPHFCYIIASPDGYTYNGYTCDTTRRLKQHCGELKGGAKSTRGRRWEFIAIIECTDSSYQESLSLEWHIRYPTNRKPRPKEFCGREGRIRSLPLVFANPKFAEKFFVVNVASEFFEKLQESCREFKNVVITVLSA